MANRFPPNREAELVPWSANYKAKIVASPTTYSLTAPQAAAYGTLHDDFVTKWNVCQNPETKTKVAVEEKDAAKLLLIGKIRELSKIVNNSPTTTNALRLELGLPERDGEATPINAPTVSPALSLIAVNGWIIKGRVKNAAGDNSKPAGCVTAWVYSYVGAAPPTELADWQFQGAANREIFEIEFAGTVPAGSKIYLTAQWVNPRNQPGPACTPIFSYLGGGVAEAA